MIRALWHISPVESQLESATRPQYHDLHEVQALYSLVSTGTEKLVACGHVSSACAQEMSVPYMEGSFDLPIKYGYSLVGTTSDGRIVHCMHPHQSIAFVDVDAIYCPTGLIPARRLALLSNVETVLTAIWDAEAEDMHDVAVCGFGNIGCLLANTLRVARDISPIVAELDDWRRGRAIDLGYEVASPGADKRQFATLFHTTGDETGLQWCIDHASREGRVIELSWYGSKPVTLELGNRFHHGRLRIISSQVSSIPGRLRDQVSNEDRKRIAADLLTDPSFDELITNEVPFDESPAFFDELRAGTQDDGLVWVIRY